MPELNFIKEEVYKCSKCGLCQSVCPLYIATKNEMYLSRGRYNVLNNFFQNNKNPGKKFVKDLDICLNCNICKDFCPSNIDAAKIFTLMKKKLGFKSSFIPFYIRYRILLNIKRIFNIWNLRQKKIKGNSGGLKVTYFQGCYNKYINSSDKNATLNILKELGYNVISVNKACCGLPYLSDGEINLFKKNIERIKKSIPKESGYIVCSCDSCYETLKPHFEKVIRLDELVKKSNLITDIRENTLYHKPLIRKSDLNENIKKINKKGICTLMENFFMLKHKNLSDKFFKNLFYDKKDIENKTIITTCNIAKWGLIFGIKRQRSNTKILSYSEYINNQQE